MVKSSLLVLIFCCEIIIRYYLLEGFVVFCKVIGGLRCSTLEHEYWLYLIKITSTSFGWSVVMIKYNSTTMKILGIQRFDWKQSWILLQHKCIWDFWIRFHYNCNCIIPDNPALPIGISALLPPLLWWPYTYQDCLRNTYMY